MRRSLARRAGPLFLLFCVEATAQPAAPPASTGQLPPASGDATEPIGEAPPAPAQTAPAPAPAPSATIPAQPPPPTGYPPTGYPPAGYAPHPPPGYAPPGWGYYPPPGYYAPPGYEQGYPPPVRVKPEYPSDSAGQTSPFFDVLTAGITMENRFGDFFTVGVQGGGYLAARIRLTARVLMFVSQPGDDLEGYSGEDALPAGYLGVAADEPSFVYGASLGAAPLVRRNFVFAPGLAFMRSDVADYGTFVGLSLPFDWVTDDGARFGFEIDVGRAFGGNVTGRCEYSPCPIGSEQTLDRPSGPAFYGAFEFGWGFNHPPARNPAQ